MGISYSVETDPDRNATAMLRDRQISLKHSKALSNAVRGETLADAQAYLEAVLAGERSVPFKQHNTGVGHRSDIEGWDAGRYPEKATEAFLELLENAQNNAEQQGFEPASMVIDHLAPHKVGESRGSNPRAFGQADQFNATIVDVELVLEEAE